MRYAENRLRCAIDPGKNKETAFKDLLSGSATLVAFKDTTFAIEFALFNGSKLYDISNIITLKCKVHKEDGTNVLVEKVLNQDELNNALTLDAANPANWNNFEEGDEHGVFEWTQDQTGAAGDTYEVTVYGVTDKGTEVFGISKLKLIDRKLTNVVMPAPGGPQLATIADLIALNAQTVKYGVNPAGKTFTLQSRNGGKQRRHGTNDDGSDMNELVS